MKRITITFFGALFFLLLLSASAAPATTDTQGNQQPKEVVFSQTTTVEATIQDIDYKNRIVTLKGPQGNTVRVDVGQDAPNFNQLKKGDKVKAQYYESTALSIQKPGEEMAPTGQQQQMVAVPGQGGQGPSRLMVNTTQVAATVQEIDQQNRTVTLKGPEGNIVKMKVDPSVKGFDRLKKGDQVVATFTDALALSVERE